MRIIAGDFRGMRLKAPKTQHIRPTSDRVREFIFSCIQMDIFNSSALDLFAGTGALGIEALSRGAKKVVFVDQSAESTTLIRQNLAIIHQEAHVLKQNAVAYLKRAEGQFDFIFCDPPYAFDGSEILQLVSDKNMLTEDGLLIYETGFKQPPKLHPGLIKSRQKKMGDTLIIFYKKDHENSDLSGNI